MKKVLYCLFTLCLALSLTACAGGSASSPASTAGESSSASEAGSSEAVSSQESAASAESSSAESSAAQEESSAATGLYATVKEFAASEQVQSALASIKSTLDADTMDVELVGEDNKLIYNFTFKNLDGQDLTALGASLQEALEGDSMASTFGNIAKSLVGAVTVKDPTVQVNYLAPDGALLAGKEYTAQ